MAAGTSTRKTVKKAEELRISQVRDFKFRMGGMMKLPSGLVVKTKNPGGLQAFLTGGIIPNNLMVIIKEALDKGKAPEIEKFMATEGDEAFDPEMMKSMEIMLNGVAVKTIIDPEIHPVPESEADRSDELLYADEIPMEDKQFLMQWVSGGTRDLEQFRKQLDSGMGSVVAESSAVSAAQSRAGLIPR